MAKIRLTPEGVARLQSELEHLTHVRRVEVGERIRQAREESHGDSGDSTAYEDAKTELALIEQRIAELDRTLSEVEIVPESGGETHFCDMYGAYERLDPTWKWEEPSPSATSTIANA